MSWYAQKSAHEKRVAREKKTIRAMFFIYCRKKHGKQKILCASCQNLLDYAFYRIQKCPHKTHKPTCKTCPIHCYQPDPKEKVKEVMRTAGPAMSYRHPVLSFYHFLDKFQAAIR